MASSAAISVGTAAVDDDDREARAVDIEDAVAAAVARNAEVLVDVGCSVFVVRQDGLGRVRGEWRRAALEDLFSTLFESATRHVSRAPIEVRLSRRRSRLRVRVHVEGDGYWLDDASLRSLGAIVAELDGVMEVTGAPDEGVSFEILLRHESSAR